MATTLTQTLPLSDTHALPQRRYTVGYAPQRGDTSRPALNLSGKWLREAGFDTGTGVTVKIADGCIVLIADDLQTQELRKELKQLQ